MRTVNEVILVWWIANEPLMKEITNGQHLVVFNLSTKRVWITKEWEKREESQFHKMACWWKMWERIIKILNKWDLVYVRWYLHNRKIEIEWEEKKRILTEVVINDILILNRKNDDDNPVDNDKNEKL